MFDTPCYMMGCFYQIVSNHKKAAKHFEIALILNPNNIEISNKLDQVIAPKLTKEMKELFGKTEIAGYRGGSGSHWTAWEGTERF
uniref:Tetratricopeptide repeat protein n=1 Tax=Strigamia maritima TaxID=126957 RepID=T1JKA2_STRMM